MHALFPRHSKRPQPRQVLGCARERARLTAVVLARALEGVHRPSAQRQIESSPVDQPLRHCPDGAPGSVAHDAVGADCRDLHDVPFLGVLSRRRGRKQHWRWPGSVSTCTPRVRAQLAARLRESVVDPGHEETVGCSVIASGSVRAACNVDGRGGCECKHDYGRLGVGVSPRKQSLSVSVSSQC
jgi:hypothetical protein